MEVERKKTYLNVLITLEGYGIKRIRCDKVELDKEGKLVFWLNGEWVSKTDPSWWHKFEGWQVD